MIKRKLFMNHLLGAGMCIFYLNYIIITTETFSLTKEDKNSIEEKLFYFKKNEDENFKEKSPKDHNRGDGEEEEEQYEIKKQLEVSGSGQASKLDNIIDKNLVDLQLTLDELKSLNEHEGSGNKLSSDKRLFAIELFKMLHEQYGLRNKVEKTPKPVGEEGEGEENKNNKKADRIELPTSTSREASRPAIGMAQQRGPILNQLLNALNADGDISRLVDWIQNSFNLASIGELTTQFVVGKLASVNCAALLKPDSEETLVPRFLLFNEQFVDVPFEMPMGMSTADCLLNGHFDPVRKTVLLLHGYLGGYTIVDGLTNIKNRLLDYNKLVDEAFSFLINNNYNTSRLFAKEDLDVRIRLRKYNVIIVDWFNGANPIIRSRYIRAAVNAQVVGELIARFISSLVTTCKTPARNVEIIAHSLGCHVAGFTGKSLIAAGHKLGKITHLDPVGLCFGRLFSQPKYRLNPNDAHETKAVHVSLNLFDNPLDGAQANFLVNGGRDQMGCGGQSELKNSTTSSVSLLFDSETKFRPCSHLRALALFEDDLTGSASGSGQEECQIVGYKCSTYDKFLAGKCGHCDEQNNQCRLMSLPKINNLHHSLYHSQAAPSSNKNKSNKTMMVNNNNGGQLNLFNYAPDYLENNHNNKLTLEDNNLQSPFKSLFNNISDGSIAWLINDKELNVKIAAAIASLKPELIELNSKNDNKQADFDLDFNSKLIKSNQLKLANKMDDGILIDSSETNDNNNNNNNEISKRSDRRLSLEQRDRIVKTIDRFRMDAKNALSSAGSGWTLKPMISVSSMLNGKTTSQLLNGDRLTSALTGGQYIVSVQQHFGKQLSAKLNSVLSGEQPNNNNNNYHHQEPDVVQPDPVPLGGQALPPGSVNGPLYFVGTSSLSPYCVNYYQFRVLIAESRIKRLLHLNALAPNRLAGSTNLDDYYTRRHNFGNFASEKTQFSNKNSNSNGNQAPASRQAMLDKEMLHLTVKLTDSNGHFFKGFTMLEDARYLKRLDTHDSNFVNSGKSGENMLELTMLLNTTRLEPVRISETIISYYFHGIVLADLVQINYMSNITPEIRARYSSSLCPVAINDKHQLVRYIECDKTNGAK